jgi:hypothetical protein
MRRLGTPPALDPLSYPGRWPTAPVLLSGTHLLPLAVRPGRLGGWELPGGAALDSALGADPAGRRSPVLAIGSNGSPAQLAYKLDRADVAAVLPMVPARVGGLGAGVSAHISKTGFVSASPYADPEIESTLVVSWLDAAQLAAVDRTEPNYHRVFLPGTAFPVVLPSGERLDGCHAYVNRHGVLADDGRPWPAPDQRTLLGRLLAASAALRELFGPSPETFVARARSSPELRAAGAAVFRAEGWVIAQPALDRYVTG